MNDSEFIDSFLFKNYRFKTYRYSDNREGAQWHYFVYMLAGQAKIVTDSDTVEIREGDVFYIPIKCSYQSYWYGQPEIHFISLGFVLLPSRGTFPTQIIRADETSRELLLRLADAKNPTPREIGLFYTLAARLVGTMTYRESGRSRTLVNRVGDFLRKYPLSKTEEIAKAMAVSVPSLYNAFQEASDVSLNELRNRIIAEKAYDLLVTTDRSVEEISELLGFSSTSYFRKSLRRHFDMTPREIRNTIKI